MGSVCIFSYSLLPACFHDAGDFSLERHAAEADSAHLKLADEGTSAAADTAAIAHAYLEFGLLQRLRDFCRTCHLLCYPRSAQRKAEALEELAAFFVVVRGRCQRNVHALELVLRRALHSRKHQLTLQTQRVVPGTIERVRRQA